MLPKRLKVPLRQEINFFRTAQRRYTTFFSLYYQNTNSLQFLVIIPKKVIKQATRRNRLKRRIYAFLEKNLLKLDNKKIVLVLRKDIQTLTQIELEKELWKAL